MFGDKNKTIDVEFLDYDSGETFAHSNLPLHQIPDFIDSSLILNLEGEEWAIKHANPNNSREITRKGKLKLYVSKVGSSEPNSDEQAGDARDSKERLRL